MKKTRTYLTLISIAWLLAACGVDIVAPADLLQQTGDLQSAENAIVFSAGLEAVNTKAAGEVTTETNLNGKSIGVFAAYTGDIKYNLTTVSPNFMYNQKVTYNDTEQAWSYSPIKYWPNTLDAEGDAKDYVSFFCYYPYTPTTPDHPEYGGVIGFSNSDAQGDPWLVYQLVSAGAAMDQRDLLYGVGKNVQGEYFPLLDIQKQTLTGKVNFHLRHALACVGDAITIKCSDEEGQFKTALESAARASGSKHSSDATLRVYINKVTINYKNLTNKAKLILNSGETPNWQPIVSGETITSRIVPLTNATYIAEGTAHTPIITSTYTYSSNSVASSLNTVEINGQGFFYIPMHLGESQKAEITVDYTTVNSVGGTYTGSVTNSFTLAENAQKKEPFKIIFGPTLPVGLDIFAAEVDPISDLTYTGLAQTPEPVVTYEGQTLVKGTDYTLSYANNINAGDIHSNNRPTIIITGIGKYVGTSKEVNFTINKKQLIVTANDVTRTYGSQAAFDQYGYTVEGFVNGETETSLIAANQYTRPKCHIKFGTDETISTINAGTYAGAPAEETTHYHDKCIRVGGDESQYYGGQNYNGSADNYTFSYVYGTLTINKAPLHVFADDTTITYGDETPEFYDGGLTLSFVGFLNGQNASVVTTGGPSGIGAIVNISHEITHPAAGTYTILVDHDQHTTEPTNYYYASFTNGTLTVQKATLTVTAADKMKTYGEANPTLSYTITGFVNGDNSSALTTAISISTTAQNNSNVGTYPIVVNGGEANNYNFTYFPGTLTINKYHLNVEWSIATHPENELLTMTTSQTRTIYPKITSFDALPAGHPNNPWSNINGLIATFSIESGSASIQLTNVTPSGSSDSVPACKITPSSAGTVTIQVILSHKNYSFSNNSKTITFTISE